MKSTRFRRAINNIIDIHVNQLGDRITKYDRHPFVRIKHHR